MGLNPAVCQWLTEEDTKPQHTLFVLVLRFNTLAAAEESHSL